jgi:hypothetical protein
MAEVRRIISPRLSEIDALMDKCVERGRSGFFEALGPFSAERGDLGRSLLLSIGRKNPDIARLIMRDAELTVADVDRALMYGVLNDVDGARTYDTRSTRRHQSILRILVDGGRTRPSAPALREALQAVIKQLDMSAINVLLNDGEADPNDPSAFEIGCAMRQDAVRLLISDPRFAPERVVMDDAGTTALDSYLEIAAKHGDVHTLTRLLKHPRVDPNERMGGALICACSKNKIECVRRLLEDPRVDPSVGAQHVLMWAAKRNEAELVRGLLLDPRVDPTFNHREVERNARCNGSVEVFKVLAVDPRMRRSDVPPLPPDLKNAR